MARCAPDRARPTRGARTTQARDHCRRERARRYLRRGGRPRSSAWWRAWIAKLLPADAGAPPESPPIAPVPLQSTLDQQANSLSIDFDTPLDPDSTVVASQFRYGDGAEMHVAFGAIQVSGATLTVSIITPPTLPLGSGAWLFPGAGELRGANGALVQPFGPV